MKFSVTQEGNGKKKRSGVTLKAGTWMADVEHMCELVMESGIGYIEPEPVTSEATRAVVLVLWPMTIPNCVSLPYDKAAQNSAVVTISRAIEDGADGNNLALQQMLCEIVPRCRMLIGNEYPNLVVRLLEKGMKLRPKNASTLLLGFVGPIDIEEIYARQSYVDLQAGTPQATSATPSRKPARL